MYIKEKLFKNSGAKSPLSALSIYQQTEDERNALEDSQELVCGFQSYYLHRKEKEKKGGDGEDGDWNDDRN